MLTIFGVEKQGKWNNGENSERKVVGLLFITNSQADLFMETIYLLFYR